MVAGSGITKVLNRVLIGSPETEMPKKTMTDEDQKMKPVTACILIIGNEILSGRTQDANLQFLASGLNDIGIQVAEAHVIPDDSDIIVAAVNAARVAHDYVLTTGGIGPTHDDITSVCIARAFGVPFGRNPQAEEILLAYYSPEDVTPERLSMADMPEGATLIENPVSRAPGFQLENVFVLPGVPRIMRDMFSGMKHRLSGGDPVLSISITSELPEGTFAGPLALVQERFPDVDMVSYPFFRDHKLGANLVLRSADKTRLDEAAGAVRQLIRDLGSEPIEDETRPGDDSDKLS